MLAFTHKLNMMTTRPDAMGIIMEDLIKNFEELSSEESYEGWSRYSRPHIDAE